MELLGAKWPHKRFNRAEQKLYPWHRHMHLPLVIQFIDMDSHIITDGQQKGRGEGGRAKWEGGNHGQLTLVVSCCLWSGGSQSPWPHPATHRWWQSCHGCFPLPAPWSTRQISKGNMGVHRVRRKRNNCTCLNSSTHNEIHLKFANLKQRQSLSKNKTDAGSTKL